MAKSPRKSSVMGRLSARMTWDRVKIRTASNEAEEAGKLVVDANSIRFVGNGKVANFSIPTEAVTEVFYKNQYMTISFDDEKDLDGAVEIKLERKNYRGLLRAVQEVTDIELVADQEGIRDE